MVFLLLNFYIVVSHYLFISRSGINILRDQIISVCITFSAQIILTQTILGSHGLLSAGYLTTLNATISSILILISFMYTQGTKPLLIREKVKTVYSFFKSIVTPYNIFVTILTIVSSIWIIMAAFLLPPRAVDDLTYHLPAIYEFILSKEIFLLPLDFRMHFVFPMNAEFLFMWSLNYYKSTISIGLIQYLYSLSGIMVVYALCRSIYLNKKLSYFSSQLFFLTPLVLLQSGSAYIEVITSVFLLFSIYVLIRFKQTENTLYLYLLAIAAGLMIGMKYTMLLHVILLLIFLLPLLNKLAKKQILLFCSIFFICCGYWYIRNLIYFANPVYPFLSSQWNLVVPENEMSLLMILLEFYQKIKLLFFYDIGLGSLNGGYGIIFWGIGIPSWIYFLASSILKKSKDRSTQLLIWSQLLISTIILFLLPMSQFEYQARFNLFAIGIGAIAVGLLLKSFKSLKIYKIILIIACCIFSVMSITQFAISGLPSYALDIPIQDQILQKNYSKWRYIRISYGNYSIFYLYETLDYITKDNRGLKCYFALSSYDFPAPIYGSNLQNRVWNFDKDTFEYPDAFIFHEEDVKKIKYIKRKFTSEDLMYNRNYALIDRSGYSNFYINNKFLKNGSGILNSLLKHYERYFENEIKSAKLLLPYMEKNIPIVTSHYIGFGLRYLKYRNIINNEIYTLPVGKEQEFINNFKYQNVYTINNFIGNLEQTIKHKFNHNNESIALILNQPRE